MVQLLTGGFCTQCGKHEKTNAMASILQSADAVRYGPCGRHALLALRIDFDFCAQYVKCDLFAAPNQVEIGSPIYIACFRSH